MSLSNPMQAVSSQSGLRVEIETKAFNDYITAYIKTLDSEKGAIALLRVSFEVCQRIIFKNPVLSGESRAGWFIPATRLAKKLGMKASYRLGSPEEQRGYKAGKFILHGRGSNKWVEFSNSVPYIWTLEYGASGQAPWGMVRISMQEIRNAIPPSIYAQLKHMWDEEGAAHGSTFRAGGYWEPKYVTGKRGMNNFGWGALRKPTTMFLNANRRSPTNRVNRSMLARAIRGSRSGVRRR